MNMVEAGAFTVENIGGAEHQGSLREVNGQIELTGSGHRFGGGLDVFTFAFVEASGDFNLVARLHQAGSSQENGDAQHAASGAGLAIRESIEPGARGVVLLVPPIGHPWLSARYEAEGGTRNVGEPYGEVPFPVWVKLERRGPSFNAWAGPDELRWSHFASTSLELPQNLCAGLVLVASSRTEPGRAVFSDIHIEELPSGRSTHSPNPAGTQP